MDDKQNITLDDILKESDDVELDPNLNISVADIINEPDDDVTEKIFQTLKENLPHPQTLPTQNSSVASESNKTQNSEQTSTKNGTSNTLSQSPLISKSRNIVLSKIYFQTHSLFCFRRPVKFDNSRIKFDVSKCFFKC
jgi:hypothetical protein